VTSFESSAVQAEDFSTVVNKWEKEANPRRSGKPKNVINKKRSFFQVNAGQLRSLLNVLSLFLSPPAVLKIQVEKYFGYIYFNKILLFFTCWSTQIHTRHTHTHREMPGRNESPWLDFSRS